MEMENRASLSLSLSCSVLLSLYEFLRMIAKGHRIRAIYGGATYGVCVLGFLVNFGEF